MTEFEVNELEEMFKRRCTQRYRILVQYRDKAHFEEFNKIISYCFRNHHDIKNFDDLSKAINDIDEYYFYDDLFMYSLLEYCQFLELYHKFVDKYRIAYDNDTSLNYYNKYDDEYFNI